MKSLLTWMTIVVIEVKYKELWFFRYVFWCSLVAVLGGFPMAACIAFRGRKAASVAAFVSFIFAAPVFIYIGVMLVWLFKIAIGGGVS